MINATENSFFKTFCTNKHWIPKICTTAITSHVWSFIYLPILIGTNKRILDLTNLMGFKDLSVLDSRAMSRSILEHVDLSAAITCEYSYKVGVVEFQLSDVYLITKATRFNIDQIKYLSTSWRPFGSLDFVCR